MQGIDWIALLNGLVDKLPSFVFGAIGGAIVAWLTYRFGTQRDLKRLEAQFKHQLLEQREKQMRDVLGNLWKALQDARLRVGAVTARLRTYPDLDRFSPQALEEFLKTSRLAEFHKQEILRVSNKTEYYKDIYFWYEMDEARTGIVALDQFVRYNSIFLEAELGDRLSTAIRLFDDILAIYEIWKQSRDRTLIEEAHGEWDKAEALVTEMEQMLRQRLAYDQSAASQLPAQSK
jgi:hypothetical protein